MADRRRPKKEKDWPVVSERVIDEIGEDPGRFLSGQTSLDPMPRIRGIASREVASAWLAVARHPDLDVSPELIDRLEAKLTTIRTREQASPEGGASA